MAQVVAPQMRRGRHSKESTAQGASADEPSEEQDDRQFVVALARGLSVLTAFRVKDGRLGNRELAERTSVPAATVSRITHTLTSLGFLNFDARSETYDLGGSSLALAHTALARLNIRRVAVPLMQSLADRSNANIGLGMRDRKMMLYVDTCEGSGLVGLRLFAGSRVPMATSATGRAYLAALPEKERAALMEGIAADFGAEWPTIRRGIEKAVRDVQRHGFCLSLGEWHKDIHSVAVPLIEPVSDVVYAISLGGPAYQLRESDMMEEHGPNLLAMRDEILKKLQPASARPTST
jgi:DNA-binding IclR family transcriptional regulator